MSNRHQIAERPFRKALRQILDLPLGEQLRLYEKLETFLADKVGRECKIDQELRARIEALAAMEKAAEHLGLRPEGPAKVKDFDRAWIELGSEWRAGQVIEAFGRWNNAKAALAGQRVPLT